LVSKTDFIAGGAMKSVFETKDFLFGDVPKDQQSQFRQNVYDTVAQRSQESMIDGFAAGISQFATSMIGLGKLKGVAELLPWVGKGITALEATKKGAAAVNITQAAVAGATAFDPHDERLSNMIQNTPLANPINEWLAADPTDSNAEARLKTAFESIGMDLTLGAVFMGAGTIYKYLKKGNVEEASKLATKMGKEAQAAIDAQHATDAAVPSGAPATGGKSAAEVPAGGKPLVDPAAPKPDVSPSVVANPTAEAKALGTDLKGGSRKAAVTLTEEDTKAVYTGMVSDLRAIATHGGEWTQTVERGHVFGQGAGVPYQKITNSGELGHFVDRLASEVQDQLDAVKGGSVLHDSQLLKDAEDITKLYHLDPAEYLGVIQQAGARSNHDVAVMHSGWLVTNRMLQDAYALSIRMGMGDYVEFGSKAAAEEALRQRYSLAASMYASTRAMAANYGRGLRSMQIKIDPAIVENLSSVDPEMMRELIAATGGNPANLARLSNVSLWTKGMDLAQFIYINNLVSGPKTQLINMLTNTYMLGARPMERILGGVIRAAKGDTSALGHVKESLKQYTYMGTAMYDGFGQAAKAFARNDSILAPHKSEVYVANRLGEASGVVATGSGFKPWDNLSHIYYNAMKAGTTAIGVPTRVLGAVDELMKQTTYRSKVMAGAYYDGVEAGIKAGLEGKALEDYTQAWVKTAMYNAFDNAGRGTVPSALREANIATFQQDLLPDTWGKTFQNMVTKHPEARVFLPFVKTPTNVIRYGVKMTPGLNLLQREYREMLSGKMGHEAMSQAYGQLAIGSMFTGAAAYLVAQGNITGQGPTDPVAAAEWRATGAQPYSFVVKNEDGTNTYINYGRYDPLAIPLGIIADLQDGLASTDGNHGVDTGTEAAITALTTAMAAQFRNKAYLLGISQLMDAVSSPGTNGERLQKYMGQVASNFVPLSSAMRQFNTDPYLRDARTMTDKVMATIPGMSESVPARYDAWGDKILGRKGLWSTDKNDIVDREQQRLALSGFPIVEKPSPYKGSIDLRDLTTSDGKNAYAYYQELSGHLPGAPPLKDLVAKLMETPAYQQAPDGDMTTKGTKMWMLHVPLSKYRSAAMKILKADPVVGEALLADQLKVVDYYRKRNAPSRATDTPPPLPQATAPDAQLGKIGEAFGVDLSGSAPKQ